MLEPSLYFAQELDEAVQVSFWLNIKMEDIENSKKWYHVFSFNKKNFV